MPIYEYYCSDCRRKFEKMSSFAASSGVACPTCQGERVRKLFSVFARSGRGDSSDADDYTLDDYGADSDGGYGGCSCGGACSCGAH
jgi:putative FmdB family regulatory protein